ncbi:MAG: hypothetical protein RIS47_980, partial [Bacteroidota bacterium]
MRTLRQKLLATFFLLTSITVGVILLFFNFDDKKNETNHQVEILNTTHQLILKDFIVFEDFLSYETINPLFFELEQSIYLMKHEELLSRIHHNFDSVAASGKVLSKVFNQIDSISAALDSYEKYTHEMVALVKLRGFKDYGLEGKMREEIHALERYKELNQIAVLTLRRHEKDFLLRGQQNYASEHKELVRNFTNEILAQNIPKERKELILNKLNNYSRYFQQIVILDQKIGLKHNDGLKFLTRSRITEIQFLMEDLTKQVSQIRHSRLSAWKYLYITIALLLVGVSLFIAFFLSKRISIKLSYLSQHMAEFVGSDFTSTTSVDTDNEEDEISQLLRNYQVLHSKSSRLISDFRVMVHEATAEVVLQKERIEK